MKREEYKSEQTLLDWLKSMGCIFYAPFTYGDLTDHISGSTLVDPSGTSVVWDSTMQMYKFLKTVKSQEKYFPVNLLYNAQTNPRGLRRLETQEYTIVGYTMRTEITTYGYPPYIVIGSYKDTGNYEPSLFSFREETDRESARVRFIRVFSMTQQMGYCDNNAIGYFVNQAIASDNRNLLSNIQESMFSKVTINPKREGNDPISMNCYVKDAMIFNRALTDTELIAIGSLNTN